MTSTFWVPASFMPTWLRTIATYNPLTALIDAARGLMLGQVDLADHLIAWAVIVALIVVTQLATRRQMVALLDT